MYTFVCVCVRERERESSERNIAAESVTYGIDLVVKKMLLKKIVIQIHHPLSLNMKLIWWGKVCTE